MDEIKLFKRCLKIGLPLMFGLILFLALLVNESGSGDSSVIASTQFSLPFRNRNVFSVTSPFGRRQDPLGSGKELFHTGMDLGAPCGTEIIASADGKVYEIGYSPDGLGNYVYVKHQTDQGDMYTAYGHMLDNSIVVEKDQPIKTGDKIGQVGSTGASTGCHLHFMIMKGKISFKEEDLVDPHCVVFGLK